MNGFIEILPAKEKESSSSSSLYVEAWVASVKPQECSAFVQWLSKKYPLEQRAEPKRRLDLSHLKRVQRVKIDNRSNITEAVVSVRKRPRSEIAAGATAKTDSLMTLKVLVCAKGSLEEQLDLQITAIEDEGSALRKKINEVLQRDTESSSVELELLSVPCRPPQSENEFQTFNTIWPTVYLPNQMEEYQEQQRQLDENETEQMRRGLESALDDARQSPMGGVVIYDPTTGQVVASASQEFQAQDQFNIGNNPLVTPYILAIQGVSRIERMTWGSETRQYLCTGYDVYGVKEPTVFEAMALVHSRIRRLIFGIESKTLSESSRHSSGIVEAGVHALPGTNHHFRAFMCVSDSDIWKKCKVAVHDAASNALSDKKEQFQDS